MDITLERILSLIPKKPDGKYVHGAKKEFADNLGLPHNIVAEWIRGKNKGYHNYIYEISVKYNVSVEWLKGETDEKKPVQQNEHDLKIILDGMSREQLLDIIARATEKLREK